MDTLKVRDAQEVEDAVRAAGRGEIAYVPPEEVQFMDVSPKQIVSVATALIPFLEHDDANRALMGSNMQRQAVPLLITEAPVVATGLETDVALNSGMLLRADMEGEVKFVDSTRIEIGARNKKGDAWQDVRVHMLEKFVGLNEHTCQNQKPLVNVGDKIEKGQVIADGAGTPVAATLSLFDAHTLYGRYWGAIETIDSLHFEACYYQAIDYAIAHGLQRVEAGAQGVENLHR